MMSKKIIYGLLVLCCCSVFLLVGCSKKADTTTTKATPRTPVQLVNDRVNASDAINGRQDTNIQDLAGRVGTLEGRPIIDLTSLTTRVLALEGLNNSALDAINASLSYRMALIEAKLAATPTPNATPTVTPTITPTNCSLVTKPVGIYPQSGNMSIINGSILFQWANCNASGYEFWFGTDPSSLINCATLSKDALFYPWPVINTNTYYFWRIVAISPCGNQSTMWWFKTQ